MHIGIVGFGYWGGNIARNFFSHPLVKKLSICDQNFARIEKAKNLFPGIFTTQNLNEIISNPTIDAIAVVTPIQTHFEIAKAALENKKHVLIEKTITSRSQEALELIKIAKENKLILSVDHTFIHAPVVKKIKNLIEEKVLGNLWYFDSIRINLGLFQNDVNVLWDLAAHDIAILLHLINSRPNEISVQASNRAGTKYEDIAYLTLFHKNNFMSHIHVNWLAPTKIRQIMVGGSEKMLIWDDLNPNEKLRIYDKGIEINQTHPREETHHKQLVKYRLGDMYAPSIEPQEPLSNLIDNFLQCILKNEKPLVSGSEGLEVVSILEAAEKSLKENGAKTPIQYLSL